MLEALAAPKIDFDTDTQPQFEVIKGGGETTPPVGKLVVASLTERENCMLGDVDDLTRYVLPDGVSYEPHAAASVGQNKRSAVEEGAIEHVRSKVEHTWIPAPEGRRGGLIMDLGRTAVETALRGEKFYQHPASLARGDVEVAYAEYNQKNLRPGVAHAIIEPKMTRKDAPLVVAKAEGLAETDSIQINWLDLDEYGQPRAAMTESILVADIPIQALVDMLADADNIFGKAVIVSDPESALSVMQTFSELDMSVNRLTEGPVTILVAVLPYISDRAAYQKVAKHLQEFRVNQREKQARALSPAERWLQFDMATEQSLRAGLANTQLQSFIESLEEQWGDKDRAIIESHKLISGGQVKYQMSRKLAVVLQNAQRNFVLTAAAVVTGNEKVLKQMSSGVAKRIYQAELNLAAAQASGINSGLIAANNNRLIATQNIKVGGGCSGTNKVEFRLDGITDIDDILSRETTNTTEPDNNEENSSDEDCDFISKQCPECGAKHVKTVVKKDKKTNKRTFSGDCGCSVTEK